MIEILVKCSFCPSSFCMPVMEYRGETHYQLRGNAFCPHCKTRIVAGRELEILPLDEVQQNLLSAKKHNAELGLTYIEERAEITPEEFERIRVILKKQLGVNPSDLGVIGWMSK